MQTLQTTQDGLGQEERTKRLAKHGYNQIEVKKKVHPLRKFFKHFTDSADDRTDHCLFFEIFHRRCDRRKHHFSCGRRQ